MSTIEQLQAARKALAELQVDAPPLEEQKHPTVSPRPRVPFVTPYLTRTVTGMCTAIARVTGAYVPPAEEFLTVPALVEFLQATDGLVADSVTLGTVVEVYATIPWFDRFVIVDDDSLSERSRTALVSYLVFILSEARHSLDKTENISAPQPPMPEGLSKLTKLVPKSVVDNAMMAANKLKDEQTRTGEQPSAGSMASASLNVIKAIDEEAMQAMLTNIGGLFGGINNNK